MKAEYDGEMIIIRDEEGDITHEIDINDVASHEGTLSDYADQYGEMSDALHDLFDEKGDEIQRQIDFLKNYYNV